VTRTETETQSEQRRRERRGGLVRQSFLISVAAAGGVLAGLLFDVAIAARFGKGTSTDAFFVGARIPLGITILVMTGANQALVPTFAAWAVRYQGTRHAREALTDLRAAVVTSTLLVSGGISLVLMALANPLMRVTAPGLDTSEVALAAS
jgi:putative peptidoglycan lipid II flippase